MNQEDVEAAIYLALGEDWDFDRFPVSMMFDGTMALVTAEIRGVRLGVALPNETGCLDRWADAVTFAAKDVDAALAN